MGKLYERLVYWLYERQDARPALPIADRLARLLQTLSPKPESIFAEECRSLVHEARGELCEAIEHRKNEIRLIRRLHRAATNTPDADLASRLYSYADICARLELLAMLYHDNGNSKDAVRTLQKCKRLCAAHGMAFEEEDLLREYQEDAKERTYRR
jgi:hypothetical protein